MTLELGSTSPTASSKSETPIVRTLMPFRSAATVARAIVARHVLYTRYGSPVRAQAW